MLLTLISIAINIVAIPVGLITQSPDLPLLVKTLAQTLLSFYGMFFFLGAITAVTEWNQIHCSKGRKIVYLFTFPLFMLTYIPISLSAFFSRKVTWKPVEHKYAMTTSDIEKEGTPTEKHDK